ncbi:MAG: winged helix-turn-helix domain-containing protein [Lachnospiraceae bacterium]|nr:winged helix-turn-helix domain-containing protein [Lachnospiraceae bacterium]
MSAEKNWQGDVDEHSQSVNPKVPKSQFDTLECTLEELAVLELIYKSPSIKQKELVAETGKSLSTIKRIMESLQKKEYIRRVDGKRYGLMMALTMKQDRLR